MTQGLPCIPLGVELDKTLSSIWRLPLSISIEFDPDKTPKEPSLICLFKEGLKPLVKAQMEQHRRQPRIIKTSPLHSLLGIFKTNSYTPHTYILCGPRVARLPEAASFKNTNRVKDKNGYYVIKCPERKKIRGYFRTSSANEFRIFGILSSSEKNLCRLHSTQEVRSMSYTLPSPRN